MSSLAEGGFVQSALLRTYRAAVDTGLLKSRVGVPLYEWGYGWYKARVEAPWLRLLRPFVRPGSTAVDVGANIGFFSQPFARWVGSEGRVVAIEPEPANFERLRRRMRRGMEEGRVFLHRAAAAERGGETFLTLNPYHPGDHRLGDSGIRVRAVTLDALLDQTPSPPVSLIKIDVQGAETRVIAGARHILAESRPALCVEVDDSALRQQGSSCSELARILQALGYRARRLRPGSLSDPLEPEEAIAPMSRSGTYADFLFLRDGDPGRGGEGRAE